MRHYFAVIMAAFVLALPWILAERPTSLVWISNIVDDSYDQMSLAIAHNPKSAEELLKKYSEASTIPTDSFHTKREKVRILLVPGHEPEYGGTEFGPLKEREFNVELAEYLDNYLSSDPRYVVIISRDNTEWAPVFAEYFKAEWSQIIEWQKAYKEDLHRLMSLGEVYIPKPEVHHNKAADDVALRLYGITKWSNENDVDMVIHIHFNDYPRRNIAMPGKYSGFSIYVPTEQLKNSTTTKIIAEKIFTRLERFNAVSNLKGESDGIIDESELIAIGANNTSDAPSMLIEYGYMYEPQFINSVIRPMIFKDLAYQTYLGIQDFFSAEDIVSPLVGADKDNRVMGNATFGTVFMPYTWLREIDFANPKDADIQDILAFQTAMQYDGMYPPSGMSDNDCPRSGKSGPCTKKALSNFQKKNGIDGERDRLGTQTLQLLNAKYSVRAVQ